MPTPAHPLDRPVWNALTTRQAALSLGDAHAVRLLPDHGLFAAAADGSSDALAALIPPGDRVGLMETGPVAAPPGTTVALTAPVHQMVAASFVPGEPAFDFVPLGDDDAAAMLALATLTEPGPFFANTHRMGSFIGVKRDGRLLAMAGERLRLPGFTEVSAVCTHPDARGRGLAGRLTRVVASRIVARGETPFLHVYAHNTAAIALYEALGFVTRRVMTLTVLARDL